MLDIGCQCWVLDCGLGRSFSNARTAGSRKSTAAIVPRMSALRLTGPGRRTPMLTMAKAKPTSKTTHWRSCALSFVFRETAKTTSCATRLTTRGLVPRKWTPARSGDKEFCFPAKKRSPACAQSRHEAEVHHCVLPTRRQVSICERVLICEREQEASTATCPRRGYARQAPSRDNGLCARQTLWRHLQACLRQPIRRRRRRPPAPCQSPSRQS